MTWHVARVTVEFLEDGDEAYFGINQTQSKDGRRMADGAFYAELWTEDKSSTVTQDLDQGLPPLGSYEPHLVQAEKIPAQSLNLKCFCEPEGQATWHSLPLPESGWAGRMVQVSWATEFSTAYASRF